MKVLHASATCMAGAPYFWSECYNKYSSIESRCFSQIWSYKDGREFPHDIESGETAQKLAEEADVILIHNKVPNGIRFDLAKCLLVIHSRPNIVDPHLLDGVTEHAGGLPFAVIAQHQPRFYEGRKFTLLPNLIDLDFYKCKRPQREVMRVGYSPSFLKNPQKDEVVWDSHKGYDETCRILERVAAFNKGTMEFQVFTGLPWAALAEQARDFDIWIDECVTGSYHRCSLQAAAMSQVAMNNADLKTLENLAAVSSGDTIVTSMDHPFQRADIEHELESTLCWFTASHNHKVTREWGRNARAWMEKHWDPAKQIEKHHLPFLTSR